MGNRQSHGDAGVLRRRAGGRGERRPLLAAPFAARMAAQRTGAGAFDDRPRRCDQFVAQSDSWTLQGRGRRAIVERWGSKLRSGPGVARSRQSLHLGSHQSSVARQLRTAGRPRRVSEGVDAGRIFRAEKLNADDYWALAKGDIDFLLWTCVFRRRCRCSASTSSRGNRKARRAIGAALLKFNRIDGITRVYDNGFIVIYD